MARTSKGHIQQLPSGSFRVKVYAGTDPVTGKQRLLRQNCPDEASAHVALGRLLAEADGGRFPDRHATVGQALDKYLEVADLEVSTREQAQRQASSDYAARVELEAQTQAEAGHEAEARDELELEL